MPAFGVPGPGSGATAPHGSGDDQRPVDPSAAGRDTAPVPGIGDVTLARMERAAGAMATAAVAAMEDRLPWFRLLSAAQRSWVTLVAQAGIAGYVEWLRSSPADAARITSAVFGAAPRELLRAVSLRRTVELVRVAIAVAEVRFPAVATDAAERAAVTESLLRYSREVAFTAAASYATFAETRGAWDDRLEALLVEAVVSGVGDDALQSRAAALNWRTDLPAAVLVGFPPPEPEGRPAVAGAAVLAGRHGDHLIVIVAGPEHTATRRAAAELVGAFGAGPVVVGPIGIGLAGTIVSARHALSGLRAASALPGADRGVDADRLLPERVLAGDAEARTALIDRVYRPLHTAPGLLRTVDAYLATGRALEQSARELFVHANTVRYRLRQVLELTGLDPWVPHDAFTLQIALAAGRLAAPAAPAGAPAPAPAPTSAPASGPGGTSALPGAGGGYRPAGSTKEN